MRRETEVVEKEMAWVEMKAEYCSPMYSSSFSSAVRSGEGLITANQICQWPKHLVSHSRGARQTNLANAPNVRAQSLVDFLNKHHPVFALPFRSSTNSLVLTPHE